MTKVSIIVPIYNPGKALKRCIESIVFQSLEDIEIILVNDGSTDNSAVLCREYARMDKRIKLIEKKNEGSIKTRRRGLGESTSPYVMFVDADDWIDRKMAEKLYSEIVLHQADVTACQTYKVFGNGYIFKRANESHYYNNKVYEGNEIKDKLVEAFLHGHAFSPSLFAKLYKKEKLITSGRYLDKIKFMGEDLFYNMEVLLNVNKVKVINEPLYYYRTGGFTSKFMPYLFEDMINGYLIQEEVIQQFYQPTFQKEMNGISIMLLNTFETCLYNLFLSSKNESEIKLKIKEYCNHPIVLKCTKNEAANKVLPEEYLQAIKSQNVDYLYNKGKRIYKKQGPKKLLLKLLNKIPV
ncbi:glycosyltransferase family 2 protein [Alkalihalobacterium bogoriense]|uniref:glycosyltransferase family 2 protein n=1 Tax=Alkalihalobacterium bogoriense TaxID=246272 RepID=UPI00047B6B5A|nr:glycosyltransferase family 2 protein [Alkalihalobacterium bogoriense]